MFPPNSKEYKNTNAQRLARGVQNEIVRGALFGRWGPTHVVNAFLQVLHETFRKVPSIDGHDDTIK